MTPAADDGHDRGLGLRHLLLVAVGILVPALGLLLVATLMFSRPDRLPHALRPLQGMLLVLVFGSLAAAIAWVSLLALLGVL